MKHIITKLLKHDKMRILKPVREEQGKVVTGKWRQLYLNNSKKRVKKIKNLKKRKEKKSNSSCTVIFIRISADTLQKPWRPEGSEKIYLKCTKGEKTQTIVY